MPSRRKRKLKIGNLIIVIVSLLVVCAGGFSLIHIIANKKDKTVIRKDPGAISTNETVETEEPKENKVSLFLTGDGLLHDSVYTDAENEDGTFDRFEEQHYQHGFTMAEVENAVKKAGLKIRYVYDAFTHNEPAQESERLYYIVEHN